MRLPPRVLSLSLVLCLTLSAAAARAQGKEPPPPPRQQPQGPATSSGAPQFSPHIYGEAEVGEKAPDFELDGSESKPVKLSAYRGRWVILAFGDRKETVAPVREVAAKLDSAGIALLGICNEKAYFLVAFAKNTRFPFLLLADVTREVSAMYGLEDSHAREVLPGYVMIDPKGDVQFALLGQSIPPADLARLARYVAARP